MTLPRVRSVNREPIVYNDNEPTRVQTCHAVMTTRAFSRRNQHRAKALCWKRGGGGGGGVGGSQKGLGDAW